MKTIKVLLTLILLFGAFSMASAQDKMFLRGKKDTLLVKVIEVGTTEIRYKMWPVVEDMPVMVESKDRIIKIIFANGTIMKFSEDEFSNENNYATQRKIAVKWDMFALTRNVLSLSAEYSIKPGMSAEIGLGYIGVGKMDGKESYDFDKANGVFIRTGVKFINTPSYYMKGMRYSHILKGGYIRPELVYVSHNNYNSDATNYPSYYSNYQTNVRAASFIINFGKQWVFSDVVCLDFFLGVGIGKKNVTYYDNSGNKLSDSYFDVTDTGGFGFIAFSQESGVTTMTFQTGLKIGGLIGSKSKTK